MFSAMLVCLLVGQLKDKFVDFYETFMNLKDSSTL